MKKLFNILIISLTILALFLVLGNNNVYATSASIETKLEEQVIEGDKLEISINVSKLNNAGEGINAYSGILSFDINELEFVEIQNGEGWNSPVYNEEGTKEGNVKITATSNQFINQETELCKVIFNIKENKDTYDVNFKEFEAAAKIDGKTVKVTEDNVQETDNTSSTSKTNTAIEETNTETNNFSMILGMTVLCALILVAILWLGFYVYKKNKNKED